MPLSQRNTRIARVTKRAVIYATVFGMAVSAVDTASACWHVFTGFEELHASRLSGVLTYESKVLKGVPLRLYKVEDDPKQSGAPPEATDLRAGTVTGADGRFDFGKRDVGKYVIKMVVPSSENFYVKMLPEGATPKELWINGYGDWCTRLRVQSLNTPIPEPTVPLQSRFWNNSQEGKGCDDVAASGMVKKSFKSGEIREKAECFERK